MNGRRFYHLALTRLAAALLALPSVAAHAEAQPAPAAEVLKLPPRSVDDITRLLDHYKPHPDVVAKTRAAADAEPVQGAEAPVLAEFYWKRGLAAAKLGRAEQAIADLRQATVLASPGSVQHARMLRDLANAEATGGNMLNAAKASDEAVSILANMQTSQGVRLGALQASTYFHFTMGDFAVARKRLEDAEQLFARLRSSRGWATWGSAWTATIERARAEIFRSEGKFVEAEGAYRKALAANEQHIVAVQQNARAMNEEEGEGAERYVRFREILQRSMAATLLAQGKLAEAEVFVRRALKSTLERVGRDSTDTALGLGSLASILAEQGRSAEAIRIAEEALKSYQQAGATEASIQVSNARKALASALVVQGRYQEGLALFERNREAVKVNEELWKKVGAGHLDWTLAMLRTGNQAGAEKMAKSMFDWAQKRYGDQDHRTATARGFYAMTLGGRGEHRVALSLYRQSVPVLLAKARDDSEAETGTAARQRRLIAIMEGYIATLAALRGSGAVPEEEIVAESFRIADVARNSVVQRALSASAARAAIVDPKLAELARVEQDAQRRAVALSELLTQLMAVPPEQQLPKVQEDLRREISALQVERDARRRQIMHEFPDYAALVAPQPVSLERARATLKAGELLLAFYLGELESYVWAVDAEGRGSFAVVPARRDAIAAGVARLRKALDPGVDAIEAIPAFDVTEAYHLYEQLLAPVAERWRDARLLLVVPHGELGGLPLALLPTAAVAQPAKQGEPFAGYRAVPWLARQVAIEQLPSVTALASLRRLPARTSVQPSFAGFGDPLFSAQQAKGAGKSLPAPSLASRGTPLKRRNVPNLAGVPSAELALLPRLPDTGEEVREIARALKADPVKDVFLNAEANEKRVLETDLAHRRVVMFATHGLVPGDLDGLTQPALALTSPEVVPDAGDGLLTMDEILSLKLDADWVVLSACNTAAGTGAGAEAVSGLGRAFFYAGARALLVSNWPVETVAARLIMTDLFRRQVDNARLGKAEALRQSMLALIDGPGAVDAKTRRTLYTYAHPLFWAPFVVVGD